MKYRPSNGTEGEIFQERWCCQCCHDQFDPDSGEGGCEILARTMAFDVDDPEYPKEWQVESGGAPRCTAFCSESQMPRCPNTGDMFGGEEGV